MPILVKAGGISNYVSPLIQHFLALPEPGFSTAFHFRTGSSDRRKVFSVFERAEQQKYQGARCVRTNLPDRLLRRLWASKSLPLGRVTLPKTDVYLATTSMLPLHSSIKRVAILHDLTPAIIPEYFAEPKDAYLKRMKTLMDSCHAIIAVSQTTADKINQLCGISKEKITVIHAGLPTVLIESASDQSTLRRFGVDRPFALYVGALAPNKNVDGTIRSFARFIRKAGLDWQLVLVGKNFMPNGYYEKIAGEEGAAQRIVFTGWLNEERWAFFRKAEVLIHLSWFEGFPLPVMEAMAFGLPVLASNRGPFPEAIPNREQLVDPGNLEEVIERLDEFSHNSDLRLRWREFMSKRALDFSWEKSARMLRETLRIAMEGGN
jgi:glycosyltransferase involved in cell wall biosynthesis